MPKVVREDIDNLNATLTVTFEKADYESRFESELSKYQKQAHMKGFRKGKMPISVLKKMYGKSVLVDVINQMLQNELNDYLKNEGVKLLGQPLPSESQEPVNFEPRELSDYSFKFDLGLAPEFELKGIGKDTPFEKIELEITDEMIDEELEAARKAQGERQFAEEDIRENDILKLFARELDGEEAKEGGLETEFSILVSSIADEAAKAQLLAGKKGDTFRFNLFELEAGKDEKYVRNYFLNLPDGDSREVGREYEVTVTEASRIIPAEMDQEFFDKLFGEGEVSSEEQARARIREHIGRQYNSQSEALLLRDIQESLMEQNPLDFPDSFLKRWMKTANEKLSDKTVEKEYAAFAKNLQWSLIQNKLVKHFNINIGQSEILEKLRNQIRGYFGGAVEPGMEQVIENTALRLMQDEKQAERAYDQALNDKLYEALLAEVELKSKKVSLKEFEEEVAKARAAARASRAHEEEE